MNIIFSLMLTLFLNSCKMISADHIKLDEMHTTYMLKADSILMNYPKRSVEGYMLADAFIACYVEYGIKVPLTISLAQCQVESGFGATNRNNPYNIRKNGYKLFSSPAEGVHKYYVLMCTNYLSCQTESELLSNFRNCAGYRYAESTSYEQSLRKTIKRHNIK